MAWSKAGRAPGSPGDKEKDLITFKRQLEGHFGFASFLHLGFSASLTTRLFPPRRTSWFSHQFPSLEEKPSASRVALGRGSDLGWQLPGY